MSTALLQVRPLPDVQPVPARQEVARGLFTDLLRGHRGSARGNGSQRRALPPGPWGSELVTCHAGANVLQAHFSPHYSSELLTCQTRGGDARIGLGLATPGWIGYFLPESEDYPGQPTWLPRTLLDPGPDALCMTAGTGRY